VLGEGQRGRDWTEGAGWFAQYFLQWRGVQSGELGEESDELWGE